MSPRATGFLTRVLAVVAAVAGADVLSNAAAVAAVGRGGHARLLAGFSLVEQEHVSTTSASLVAATAGVLIVAFALRHRGARAVLWLPAGLALGAALGTLLDLSDGRITRWLDPPLAGPVNVADVAVILGGLGLVYALGVALGGGPEGETSRRL